MINKKEIYRHYKYDVKGPKNNYTYKIIDFAFDTERKSEMVIYKPLYESEISLFVRPLSSFTETCEVGGKMIPRFKKI